MQTDISRKRPRKAGDFYMRVAGFLAIFVILCQSIVWPQNQLPSNRKYPSTLTALVLQGQWESPTDPDTISEFIAAYGAATAEQSKQWEVDNVDLLVAGNYGADVNRARKVLASEYFHTVRPYYPDSDNARKLAIRRGINFEDLSVHFSSDTIINATTIGVYDSEWAGNLRGGVTYNSADTGESLASRPDVFRGVANGGAFYIWWPEPFTEIEIELSQNGVGGTSVSIEYPSQVDDNFRVTQWSPATILSDTTNVFSQSGRIRIAYPTDWKYAIILPPNRYNFGGLWYMAGGAQWIGGAAGVFALRIRAYGFTTRPHVKAIRTEPMMTLLDGEPYLGALLEGLARGGTENTIALSAEASSSSNTYKDMLIKITAGRGSGQSRLIIAYNGTTRVATVNRDWDIVPDNTSQYKVVRRVVLIRGWDPANDRNGDGWLDDNEYANLADTNATARFRYQSRVFMIRGWNTASSWNVTNPWHPQFGKLYGEALAHVWNALGYAGCYLDDATGNGLGSPWVGGRTDAIQPVFLKGGHISEYPGHPIDKDDPVGYAWYAAFASSILTIKQVTGTHWMGGNISYHNPFKSSRFHQYLAEVMDWWSCEDTIRNGCRVDAGFSLATRAWAYPAAAARGQKSVIYAHYENYSAQGRNTRETWEYEALQLLARYYMVNIPGKTYIYFWKHDFYYDSKNTTSNEYWKAGVPKKKAFTPAKLLRVDIGVPTNTIPQAKRPLDYVEYITGIGNIKVSDTASMTLSMPGLPWQSLQIVPTYTYILQQIHPSNVTGHNGLSIPYDAVYAREFTKGLVLIRLKHSMYSIPDSDYRSNVVTVDLPGAYRKLNPDGTLGPVITQVDIKGGEGVILLKQDLKISLDTDPNIISPGSSVTVTFTAENSTSELATGIEVQLPLGVLDFDRMIFTENTAGFSWDSNTRLLTIRLLSLSPNQSAIARFVCKLRR